MAVSFTRLLEGLAQRSTPALPPLPPLLEDDVMDAWALMCHGGNNATVLPSSALRGSVPFPAPAAHTLAVQNRGNSHWVAWEVIGRDAFFIDSMGGRPPPSPFVDTVAVARQVHVQHTGTACGPLVCAYIFFRTRVKFRSGVVYDIVGDARTEATIRAVIRATLSTADLDKASAFAGKLVGDVHTPLAAVRSALQAPLEAGTYAGALAAFASCPGLAQEAVLQHAHGKRGLDLATAASVRDAVRRYVTSPLAYMRHVPFARIWRSFLADNKAPPGPWTWDEVLRVRVAGGRDAMAALFHVDAVATP
jgi:hypothetical protein